jgi:hypothetical protein
MGATAATVGFSNARGAPCAPENMIYRARSVQRQKEKGKKTHPLLFIWRSRIVSDVVISIPLSWKSDNKSLLIKRSKEFHPEEMEKIYIHTSRICINLAWEFLLISLLIIA